MGFASEIYAAIIGPGCAGRVHPLNELPIPRPTGASGSCTNARSGADGRVVARHPGRKLLDYHNITPAALVERWLPPLGEESRLGPPATAMLAAFVSYTIARSEYNAAELPRSDPRTAVVPVLVEGGNLEQSPDPVWRRTARQGSIARRRGWLFVGQIAPHKAQHDVVKAFTCYRRVYDTSARLHLVGREMGSTYIDALR